VDKLKRYLGLAVTIVLLVIAILPTGGYLPYLRASALTPLDTTVLTRLTMGFNPRSDPGRHRNMAFWLMMTHQLNELRDCRLLKSPLEPTFFDEKPRDCQGALSGLLSDLSFRARWHGDSDPALQALHASVNALSVEHRLAKGNVPRMIELEANSVAQIVEYLETTRAQLARDIYALHGIVFLLIGLMVLGRREVGELVCAPFEMLFGAAKGGARAAKRIHEKI
jgi:hypothetical protein